MFPYVALKASTSRKCEGNGFRFDSLEQNRMVQEGVN